MSEVRAEPLFFGPKQRPLFGWLYPSDAPAALGAVICSPLGYEAVSAHSSVRAFAEDAARNGIPALRMDYDGTGDSAGSDLDPDRLAGWLQSIREAVAELRNRTGVEQVCLLGIRMGATLAALVGAEHPDVAGVITIAPVIDVRGYLRELRALALAGTHAEPPAWAKVDPELQESAGFALSRATREELSTLHLVNSPLPASHGLRHVLVIDRDDRKGSEAWIDKLRQSGAQVEHQRLPGYTEMMLDSHEAVVPAQMVATATAWLKQRMAALPAHAGQSGRHAAARSAEFADGTAPAVRESAVHLDDDQIVFGILSEAAARRDQPLPLVVLLNSGAVHHIGPNRLYVTLARKWAAAGMLVLRMDLSGLGDSRCHPGEPGNRVYTQRAVQDISRAIEQVRKRHRITQCHAIGLCSGAYHGFKAAVAGVHFDSVVAINPLTFSWRPGMSLAFPEYRVAADAARYRRNAFQLASWDKLLRGGVDLRELSQVLARRMLSVSTNALRNIARRLHIYLPGDLGTQLHHVSLQGTTLLFAFATGEPGLDLLQGGAGVVVGRLERSGMLRIAMIEDADHTFTPRWSRERLIEVLDAHIRSRVHAPG